MGKWRNVSSEEGGMYRSQLRVLSSGVINTEIEEIDTYKSYTLLDILNRKLSSDGLCNTAAFVGLFLSLAMAFTVDV